MFRTSRWGKDYVIMETFERYGFSYNRISVNFMFNHFRPEELDGLAVSALGVQSRKLSNVLNG
jgi:hypothetical protein